MRRPARRMRRPRTSRQPPPSSFRSPRAPSLLLPRSYPAFPVPLPPPSFLPWICTWCRQIPGLPTFPRPWLLQRRPAAMSARLDPRGLEVWMGKSGRLDAKEKAFFFFCGDEEDEPMWACSCDGGSRGCGFFIFIFFISVFYKNIFSIWKFTEIYSGRPAAGGRGLSAKKHEK